jgi:signal peptidase II
MQKNKGNEPPAAVEPSGGNPWIFWGVMAVVVVIDVITKVIAEYALVPMHTPHEIIGEYFRLTLVYNPGAAFGLHLGSMSRWIFMGLTVVALIVLGRLYKATPEGAYLRTLALSLVCGGAIGNLIDRIRSPQGVVDFLDVGIGVHRWPTFNVADMAVSTGAAILAWVLLQEDRAAARNVVPARDS